MSDTIIDKLTNEVSRTGSFTRAVKLPNIAAPSNDTQSLHGAVRSIKAILDAREGLSGSVLDKALTMRDLLDTGSLQIHMGDMNLGSSAMPGLVFSGDNLAILSSIPTPTNLSASGTFKTVFLSWEMVKYKNQSSVEAWRSTTNSLGSAVKIGESISTIYVDTTVTVSVMYYYWVRAVGYTTDGSLVYGSFNATSGTSAGAMLIGANDLNALLVNSDSAANTQLFADLGSRISTLETTNNTAAVSAALDGTYTATTVQAKADALVAAANAATSATQASSSASGATTSAGLSATSATNSGSSATAAAASATTAATQATDAGTSASTATASAAIATSSAGAAVISASNAATSATTAAGSATTATTQAGIATTSKDASGVSAAAALVSQTAAAASETSASGSASTASTQAGIATTSKNNAGDSATAASGSASTAATKATDAGTSATNANSSASAASTSAADSLTYSNNASSSATTAAWSASTASTQAGLATTAKNAAGVSQAAALVSQNAAATSETNADGSATSASSTLSNINSVVAGAASAAVSVESTARIADDNKLFAQYTVKVDTNGYVSGFGLANTLVGATPYSDFIIRADKFSIASPSGPGVTPCIPFTVNTTTTTVNGVSCPPGVYMSNAFIQNGAITNVMIGDATIDSAKIVSLNAAKITAGYIDAARIEVGSLNASTIGAGYISADRIDAGSITAAKIDSRSLTIKDAAGNILLGVGNPLAATNITPAAGWLNSAVTMSTLGYTGALNATANQTDSITNSAISSAASTADWTSVTSRPTNLAGLDSTASTALGNTLRTNAASTLSAVTTVAAAVVAGVRVGSLVWDAAGAWVSGSGVAITPAGLVGATSTGVSTFSINAATGAATFAGALSAATGSFAGSLSAATGTFAGSIKVGDAVVSGTSMTGAGAAINSGGTFALGNVDRNITGSATGAITINGDLIATGNIVANNVTTMTTKYIATLNAGTTGSLEISLTHPANGGQILIMCSCNLQNTGDNASAPTGVLLRNGTAIAYSNAGYLGGAWYGSGGGTQTFVLNTVDDSAPVGDTVYTLEGLTPAYYLDVNNISITAFERKR